MNQTTGLGDGDQLRSLLGRYCDLIDAGDFDAVGELFAEGQLVDAEEQVIARGAAEVAQVFASQVTRYDGSPRTKHLVLNSQIDLDGDVARVRSSYLVLQAIPDRLPLQPIITGRYVDTFTRGPAGWAWSERRFGVDLVGDVSHHLRS